MNIPKGRISYSMWNLWCMDKEKFRKRYYENEPSFESRETIFGKNIASMLERNEYHPILAKVPSGTHKEYRIETVIQDMPVLAFLDSCSPATGSLFEIKSGRIPWNQQRVDTHDQLPFYCMCLQAKLGYYDPHVLLIWLETQLSPRTELIGGITFYNDDYRDLMVKLTGRLQVFTREVKQSDIDSITERVLLSAKEIETDYATYKISTGT